MIQVKLNQDSKFGKSGSVLLVERNEAHTIIDKGLGGIYKRTMPIYRNRMMVSSQKRFGKRKNRK